MPTKLEVERAVRHLRRRDPVLRGLIKAVGSCRLRPRRDRFQTLVTSILSQQISSAAARTIRANLDGLAAPGRPTAVFLFELPDSRYREAGVSPQKASYLRDLAAHVLDGRVRFRRHHGMTDAEVIEELTQVRGVGVWTAQMFLIFSLGRPDVLPTGDLGIRAAIRQLYRLDELPDGAQCEQIAAPWRPYASVASWYCWRSHELPA